ncbi:GlxA family transcriptional regulator [Micromonospora endophytica]|uniref:AraC family transcriptional regulator n=1 Tax=Micromonospora endophytica TaxID=515350 RepID=A0A2W2D0F5_9ACTN|nr:helix-turn-helix domain-containing protein [Micromonospora endophytica]PZF97248.1 AraC family transcriptional regulator [Micromonospora endophytica]RIW51432.1 helix-turn-helix domain-containing protein [Micromonospora endophytica]BCJ62149.1 AraC family transcriptional regulator [Micromonospora endophytica]
MRPHLVAVAVTDNLPIFELAVPQEVFGTDRRDIVDPWYELRLCAAAPGPLRTTGGSWLDPAYGLDDLVVADTVLVPACARPTQIAPPAALVEALREAYAQGSRIVGVCTGAYAIAAAGLLDGRRATTHWMNAQDFAARFPLVDLDTRVLYVADGTIFTSAGTAAAIDLCLHLVRQDHGAAVAAEVARRMVVAPHRAADHTQYPAPPVRGVSPADLSPVLEWARGRLDEPLSVTELARAAHLSPRTLARRFRDTLGTTPLQWLLEQRVRLAQELLETTDEPVERIAQRTGFGTGASLRQHFHRVSGMTPQTYRHVFRHRSATPARHTGPAASPVSAR